MRKPSIYTSIIAFIAVMAVSCNTKNKNDQTEQDSISTDTVRYGESTVEINKHLLNKPEYPACEFTATISYPEKYKNDSILKIIQKKFVSSCFGDEYVQYSPTEALKQFSDSYIKKYDTLEDDLKKGIEENKGKYNADDFIWLNYVYSVNAAPIFNNNLFACYSVQQYEYTGGAHGMTTTTYEVINLENGNPLTLEDIFNSQDFEKVNKVILSQLLKDLRITSPAQLVDAGFFDPDGITATENFYIDNTGVVWLFNPYEIACYAVGSVKIPVPYNTLKPYIKPDSPVMNMIEN